jgi:hypothetical protein
MSVSSNSLPGVGLYTWNFFATTRNSSCLLWIDIFFEFLKCQQVQNSSISASEVLQTCSLRHHLLSNVNFSSTERYSFKKSTLMIVLMKSKSISPCMGDIEKSPQKYRPVITVILCDNNCTVITGRYFYCAVFTGRYFYCAVITGWYFYCAVISIITDYRNDTCGNR